MVTGCWPESTQQMRRAAQWAQPGSQSPRVSGGPLPPALTQPGLRGALGSDEGPRPQAQTWAGDGHGLPASRGAVGTTGEGLWDTLGPSYLSE